MVIKTTNKTECHSCETPKGPSRRNFLRNGALSLMMPTGLAAALLSPRLAEAASTACVPGSFDNFGYFSQVFDDGPAWNFLAPNGPGGAQISAGTFATAWGYDPTPNFVNLGGGLPVNASSLMGASFLKGPSIVVNNVLTPIMTQAQWNKILKDCTSTSFSFPRNDDGAGEGQPASAQGFLALTKSTNFKTDFNLGGGTLLTPVGLAGSFASVRVTPSTAGLAAAVSFPSAAATNQSLMTLNDNTFQQILQKTAPLGKGKAWFDTLFSGGLNCAASGAPQLASSSYGSSLFDPGQLATALNTGLGTAITSAQLASADPRFLSTAMASYQSSLGTILQVSASSSTNDFHAVGNAQRASLVQFAGQQLAWSILGMWAAGITSPGAKGYVDADGAGSAGQFSSITSQTLNGITGSVPFDGQDDGNTTTQHYGILVQANAGAVNVNPLGYRDVTSKSGGTAINGITGGATPQNVAIAKAFFVANMMGSKNATAFTTALQGLGVGSSTLTALDIRK